MREHFVLISTSDLEGCPFAYHLQASRVSISRRGLKWTRPGATWVLFDEWFVVEMSLN